MSVLLFDGICNLCNASVQWVILRDKKGVFKFAAIQSEAGQTLLKQFGLHNQPIESVILIKDERIYTKSDAALMASSLLGWPWSALRIFQIVPLDFRNAVYDWIAKNRYRWFGKQEQCMLPKPEWKNRFLS